MVSKFLPVGLMVLGIGGLASVANAQQWGGCSPAQSPAIWMEWPVELSAAGCGKIAIPAKRRSKVG